MKIHQYHACAVSWFPKENVWLFNSWQSKCWTEAAIGSLLLLAHDELLSFMTGQPAGRVVVVVVLPWWVVVAAGRVAVVGVGSSS